jgi:UDP-glucose 4-epimerase
MENNFPKRVLVTGGAGFIGSHIIDEAIKLGFATVALDDLSGGFRENVNAKAEFIEGSINDEALIKKLFEKNKFTYVYHLAAYAAEGLSHFIKKFNYENNLIGSINLINASVNYKVKCFIFTSSIAVYGKGQLPMTEDMTPKPEDSYGIAKFTVEQELKATNELFGLDHIIFRPHNVYGERQNVGDKYRNVIGIFMNQIMQGKPLSIFGDGEQSRAFSYIGDVAPIIVKAPLVGKAYNHIFNIGADVPYSVNKLAAVVCKAMGVKPDVTHFPARNEVMHAYSDHSKTKKFFNYQARTSLEEGINKMAEWAKKAGARESKEFGEIEIWKNLPKAWLPK